MATAMAGQVAGMVASKAEQKIAARCFLWDKRRSMTRVRRIWYFLVPLSVYGRLWWVIMGYGGEWWVNDGF